MVEPSVIRYDEYMRQYSIKGIGREMSKNLSKVSITKVSSPNINDDGICIQKIYKPYKGRNLESIARLHLRIQELQDHKCLRMHTARIYFVSMLYMPDGTIATCILEEYIKGKTVEEILEKKEKHRLKGDAHKDLDGENGGLSEKTVADYIIQICAALNVLHNQAPPIIHRDIKPGNIMVTNNGKTVKLIDFDISREEDEGKTYDTRIEYTENFGAPEQYGIQQTVVLSDIYALGVTMHLMLIGLHEHYALTNGEAFYNIHDRIKGINHNLKKLIIQCTEPKLGERLQSVSVLGRTLYYLYEIDWSVFHNPDIIWIKDHWVTGEYTREEYTEVLRRIRLWSKEEKNLMYQILKELMRVDATGEITLSNRETGDLALLEACLFI